MMSAKPEAWVGGSTVECSAGKPLTQRIFGLDETLGCPGGHRLSAPQQRACGLGHHRSPSPLLLPGLGMSGSWYLSPLEDLKWCIYHLSSLSHTTQKEVRATTLRVPERSRLGHCGAVGRCFSWCQQLSAASPASQVASAGCELRRSMGRLLQPRG